MLAVPDCITALLLYSHPYLTSVRRCVYFTANDSLHCDFCIFSSLLFGVICEYFAYCIVCLLSLRRCSAGVYNPISLETSLLHIITPSNSVPDLLEMKS